MMRNSSRLSVLLVTLTLLAGVSRGTAQSSPKPNEIFSQMQYRYIGPPGNRVTSVIGVPGDPNIYYAGAASGGVWKSTDGGTH